MSFTSIVKNEVAEIELNDIEKISQLSAIISSSTIENSIIKIVTENSNIAKLIYNLLKDLYQVSSSITMRKGFNYQKNNFYILQIKEKPNKILQELGLIENSKILKKPKQYIVDDEEELRAYLRGVFLMSGSINDPKKSRYHLEFLVDNLEYGNFLVECLNKFYLNSKILKRENKYMIYVKEAEKIGDFLRVIKANNAVMYYEDIRIYRDHKNMTNRLNNCEQANVDRTIQTASNQINDIELIIENMGLDLLDEKEQIVANYRMKYKDVSLLELSEIISLETGKPITKSGLYHRFKKISELANKIRKNK